MTSPGPDSGTSASAGYDGYDGEVFADSVFAENNKHISKEWVRIGNLYPEGRNEPLLPEKLSFDDFGQGIHYECFMISTLSAMMRVENVIRNCFVTKEVQPNGRYVFQFFRNKSWVQVEIDDTIALEDGEVLYIRSPTHHWWPLLLEKAYAKFYTAYDHLEGCTLQETFHDMTGNPVLNIPTDHKLAKSAGVPVATGPYWLDLAQKIQKGSVVASGLTKSYDLSKIGMEKQQQYGIRSIFSMNGASTVKDIVVHIHNPFEDEEYLYQGPLNPKDSVWTPRHRVKYNVDDERSIFLPLNVFLKIFSTVQVCMMLPPTEVIYFDDEWKGETAGGNPTKASWRKNPLFLVKNSSHKEVSYLVAVKQRDQRESASAEEATHYLSCGLVLTRYSYPSPIPTYFVTGNNHHQVHRSLFCDVREVASLVTIPADSLCYLVPCCMEAGAESEFTVALYPMPEMDTSGISIQKLQLPELNWEEPQCQEVELHQKEKRRVDFYTDAACEVHILLRQLKPFVSKSGGDAMAQDYMGIHLYDDTDRRIGGVHSATNYREVSVVQKLPRSGRYAISVTCSRAVDLATAEVIIVTSKHANARIVDPPEDADELFGVDEEAIDDDVDQEMVISSEAVDLGPSKVEEVADSDVPFEDKRFYVDNRSVTSSPWIHIGDLYPEGKTQPLLPERLSREQFAPGARGECSCLTAVAALVDHHEEVIRNCFVSKNVRRDGGYTFQFQRFGEWVKVEIDDRIPMDGEETVFCQSPTRHWWPLLLEKAYAKFYTLYKNLEGCIFSEVFHDLTGLPVLDISTDVEVAAEQGFNFDDVEVWRAVQERLTVSAFAATSKGEGAAMAGLAEDRSYAIVDVLIEGTEVKVVLYDPFEAQEAYNHIISLETLLHSFAVFHEGVVSGALEPGYHFFGEWGEGTNGGDPSLVTWRKNPMYVVRNVTEDPVEVVAMIRLRDQRHRLHRQTNQQLNYVENMLVLAVDVSEAQIPTFLVTGNNHDLHYHENVLNARETASRITIPPRSLCYLVPSALYRDRFLLSFWPTKESESDAIEAAVLDVRAARQAPGIQHLELSREVVGRVDFMVDTETDIHILLSQKKAFKCLGGGDAIAEDYFTMELYNDQDICVASTGDVINYREVGLVHHLLQPGRYALAVACLPLVADVVTCEVQITGTDAARVRITDTPEGAREVGMVDFSFLDQDPEGVPVEQLPLRADAPFQHTLDAYKRYNRFPAKYGPELKALEERLNERCHEVARELKETHPEALEVTERETHEHEQEHATDPPVLEAEEAQEQAGETDAEPQDGEPQDAEPQDAEPQDAEPQDGEPQDGEREAEKEEQTLEAVEEETVEHPEHNAVAESAGDGLEAVESARRVSDDPEETPSENLSILSEAYEGIPISHLHLFEDEEFCRLRQERIDLLGDPIQNASAINALEEAMQERARAIARAVHAEERAFLDPNPQGIPLAVVPLDEDEEFTSLESQRRLERRQSHPDAEQISHVESELEARSQALAKELKRTERELFLDPQPLRVPLADLSLDDDAVFHEKEVERLEKRKEDPTPENLEQITVMEKVMMERVVALAQENLSEFRRYLDQEPEGIPLEHLGLDHNPECNALEDELRELKKNPEENAAKIEVVQNQVRELVRHIASSMASMDRDFLDPEPEGRLITALPLDEIPEFSALDKEQRRLCYLGQNSKRQEECEHRMNDIAHEVAHQINVEDRPNFLALKYKGVPIEELYLDADATFTTLEVHRAALLQDPVRNDRVIQETEVALVNRAMDLADAIVASVRDYLDPAPDTVPVRFLPLARDTEFSELEASRMEMKSQPDNAEAIQEVERKLNERAVELAHQVRAQERQTFIRPKYLHVSFQDLPLTTDEAFRALEVQRILDLEASQPVEEVETQLHSRAVELAKELLHHERQEFLEPAPLGVPLEELVLEDHEELLSKQEERRELQKKSSEECSSATSEEIEKLEEEMKEISRRVASEELNKHRGFLSPEPLDDKKLNEDETFHELEVTYRQLKRCNEEGNEEQMEELENQMNQRSLEISKQIMKDERPDYLTPTYHSVPYEDLGLDEDEQFENMEWERARLVRSAEAEKDQVIVVESRLESRVEELAAAKVASARGFLEPEPEGVPLKYLPLNSDERFIELEAEHRAAVTAGDSEKVAALEADLISRAKELAVAYKESEMALLGSHPHGVEVHVLHLYADDEFTTLLPTLREAVYAKDVAAIEAALPPLDERAAAVALRRLHEDRHVYLDGGNVVEDVLVRHMRLDEDEIFHRREVARAMAKANHDEEHVETLNQKLHNRAVELSNIQIEKDYNYLEGTPSGVPIQVVHPHRDGEFFELMNSHRDARRGSHPDPAVVEDLTKKLNSRAQVLADALVNSHRNFLYTEYESVPLGSIPIDEDEHFRSLETERAIAMAIPEPEMVTALEEHLHQRASELALLVVSNLLDGVEENPQGIPLFVLHPQSDIEVQQLLKERLLLRETKSLDPEAEQSVVQKMNDRVLTMADAALTREYLGRHVADVPVRKLSSMLVADEAFHTLEVQRLVTQHDCPEESGEVERLEAQLRERAEELAKEYTLQELSCCEQKPRGIPLELLHPMRDTQVKQLLAKRHQLLTGAEDELEQSEPEGSEEEPAGKEVEPAEAKMTEAAEGEAEAPEEKAAEMTVEVEEGEPAAVAEEVAALEEQVPVVEQINVAELADVPTVERFLHERVLQMAEEAVTQNRDFLPAAPGNVPLPYLGLDTDEVFAPLEAEIVVLKLSDKEENATAIEVSEKQLVLRVEELAQKKKEAELSLFEEEYEGQSTESLKPHEDGEFMGALTAYRELELNDPENAPRKEELFKILEYRLAEIALEGKDGSLWFIDEAPQGIPRDDLRLHSDSIFEEQYQKRRCIKEANGSLEEVERLQRSMNERANVIAENLLNNDFNGVEQCPRGLPLQLLKPTDDVEVNALLARRHKAHGGDEEEGVVAALNERVEELAKNEITGHRSEYLEPRPKGIALNEIPTLDTDPIFSGLEVERAKLYLTDNTRFASQIADLDQRLKERSEALAMEVVQSDLRPLEAEPETVPILLLQPHNDETFSHLAAKARLLRAEGEENGEAVLAIVAQMNERAIAYARERMAADRDSYLDEYPEGVSLSQLPLDTDVAFHTLEKRRFALTTEGTEKGLSEQKKLEEHLNYRAHELALERLQEDFDGLNHAPKGVPLEMLQPHGKFSSLVPQLRKLKSGSEIDRLHGVQHQLDHILEDMASDFLRRDRATYLDPSPDGVPLQLVPLDQDEAFKTLESQRFHLVQAKDPQNRDAIRNLEDDLNSQAVEVAKLYRVKSRLDFLPHSSDGIPLEALNLSEDCPFVDLENKRYGHKVRDPERNAAPIHLLEGRMRDRVLFLSKELAKSDLEGIHDTEGIPLSLLCPHNDTKFLEMVFQRRELNAAAERDGEAINALVARMNERVGEIAREAISGDRSYLECRPEGIPVSVLHLNEDNLFHQLEVERAIAILSCEDEEKVKEMEDRLNHRAAELAMAQVAADLSDLNPSSRGVPTVSLKPHLDDNFADLADARRPQSPESESYAALTERMNERLEKYVEEIAEASRFDVLASRICGVPVELIPLNADESFRQVEAEMIVAKQSGEEEKKADAMKAMRGRAEELAMEVLRNDREYLGKEAEGIPVEELPLDNDKRFTALEIQRASIKYVEHGEPDAQQLEVVEKSLVERATELAKQQFAKDLEGLERYPRTIPMERLEPHSDKRFCSMLPELRKLKRNPARNGPNITAVQAKLNKRLDELAKNYIDQERAFLDREPEGVPLSVLPLDDDRQFLLLEKQLRQLRAFPEGREAEIETLQTHMNHRAHELALVVLKNDRSYLYPIQAGVHISDVPIDQDDEFNAMEKERAKLKENPEVNKVAIEELEKKLNERAHKLALKMKEGERDFLRPTSSNIPTELLPLDDDTTFTNLEQQLRRLKHNSDRNADALDELRALLQRRADELGEMTLKKERYTVIDGAALAPYTVEDIFLDDHEEFCAKELERVLHQLRDAEGNTAEVSKLGEEMNSIAQELARAQRSADREFLDQEPEGIPLIDVPLDEDPQACRLEDLLRLLRKEEEKNLEIIEQTKTKINNRSHELARMIKENDIHALSEDLYHGVMKEDLNLHSFEDFRQEANRYREKSRQSNLEGACEHLREMDRLALLHANELVLSERAILDQEPEGMMLEDVPLDENDDFLALEAERRRRLKDPLSKERNESIVAELEKKMNQLSHQTAMEEFRKRRTFMEQTPQGVPLAVLPLDSDDTFRAAEMEYYRATRNPESPEEAVTAARQKMSDRAMELALEVIRRDTSFLDPEPEGVPLEKVPLHSDELFQLLAKERLEKKSAGSDEEEVHQLEVSMNERSHQLAKDLLECSREYLEKEPQNVPIEHLPLSEDPVFKQKECGELLKAREDKETNAELIERLEAELNARANEIAREKLAVERSNQEQEPFGVQLEDLPLNYDEKLNPLERQRRVLNQNSDEADRAELEGLEKQIEERVREIAKEYVDTERHSYLEAVQEGVLLRELPLNEDEALRALEKRRRIAVKQENEEEVKRLESEIAERVREIARSQNTEEEPPVEVVGQQKEEAEAQVQAEKEEEVLEAVERIEEQPEEVLEAVESIEEQPEEVLEAVERIEEQPEEVLEAVESIEEQPEEVLEAVEAIEEQPERVKDRSYLHPQPRGIPLEDLHLDDDEEFRRLEEERFRLLEAKEDTTELEVSLNRRTDKLAEEYIKRERDEFLEEEPEGVPRETLPLDEDEEFHEMEVDRRSLRKKSQPDEDAIKALEERLNIRVSELAKLKKGWQDTEFFDANCHVAPEWHRLRELFPESVYEPATPDCSWPVDTVGKNAISGYLVPFIAAVATHTALVKRILPDPAHPQFQPYVLTLFDSSGHPVTVEVDDRVPCDAMQEPMFTSVADTYPRMWYPILFEKAYAKYVGGYDNIHSGNPYDTLHTFTGRPVLNIPLIKSAALSDCTTAAFWRSVAQNIHRGDLFLCQTDENARDGLQTCACYNLLNIVDLQPRSDDTLNIGICLYNGYTESSYTGERMTPNEIQWPRGLPKSGGLQHDSRVFVMPLEAFLRNFARLFRCVVNCGGRYNSSGEWSDYTAGGGPKFTSHRKNPMYLVENKTATPAPVLVELLHEEIADRYPYTGMALLKTIGLSRLPPTTLVSATTHELIQKVVQMDSKRLCAEMEIPPLSTCYLIPYTQDRSARGKFRLSLYPGISSATLTPVRGAGLTTSPLVKELELLPGEDKGASFDFTISDACDVHILVAQKNPGSSDPNVSDINASDAVMVIVFNEYGIKVATSGESRTLKEQTVIFRAPNAGRYRVMPVCTIGATGAPCPVSVYLYAPRDVRVEEVEVLEEGPLFTVSPESARFAVPQRPMTGSSLRRDRSKNARRQSTQNTNQRPSSSGSPGRGRR